MGRRASGNRLSNRERSGGGRAAEPEPPEPPGGSRVAVPVTVVDLLGAVVLGPEDFPVPVRAESVWARLTGAGRWDRLLHGTEELPKRGEVRLLPGQLSADPAPGGDGGVVALTLVRVDAGLLGGLDDETVEALIAYGAVQDSPRGFLDQPRCLSLCKSMHQSLAGGGWGSRQEHSQVLLTPDGRIFAKRYDEDDYMERTGEYNCSSCWQIAEGTFEVEGPADLRLAWTAWAELRARNTEPLGGPAAPTSPWEAKLVDAAAMRGPSVLVPTRNGILNLTKLCKAWAAEDGGATNIRPRASRSREGPIMPNLSGAVLQGIGFDPQHLSFWVDP